MAKAVSHRAQLEQLRDQLREERRKAVQKLGPRATARNFTLTRFITLQRAIEAAERAIQDEIAAEEKAAPFDQLEHLKVEYKEEK